MNRLSFNYLFIQVWLGAYNHLKLVHGANFCYVFSVGALEASFNRFIPSSGTSCLCTICLHMLKTCMINMISFITQHHKIGKYNWAA